MKTPEELIAFARESLNLSQDTPVELTQLGKRGSDRAYYRLRWLSNSAILAQYETVRPENAYYADIAQFLLSIGIPVPKIIRHDAAQCLVLQEDLGTMDLWMLRNSPWEVRRSLYQKALAIVHTLHAYPECDFPSARVRLMESFGPDLYRWERDYFTTHFVGSVCRIELDADAARDLEIELAQLARRMTPNRRSLVHRDLQSQNIMICDAIPFLIDFQGMRFGNRLYDLGSLLCDPYAPFAEDERMELLSFYYEQSKFELNWDGFQQMFWEASAQRLMQALGAYGFLGIQRGLQDYVQHIPAGLRNLRLAAQNAGTLPRLLELCGRCAQARNNSKFEIRDSKC